MKRMNSSRRIASAILSLAFALISSAALATIPSGERAVLTALYTSTGGANWTTKTGWNGVAGTECIWYGVTCDQSQTMVVSIDLHGNNLVGPLPSTLNNLTHLVHFDVWGNHLTGSIPSLSGLISLAYFDVDHNNLTGSIPSLTGLGSLQYFDVDRNQLTGSIPALGGLTSLTRFDVSVNQLTGALPAFSGLTNLNIFYAYGNQLSGSIPALTALTNIHDFAVGSNLLTGQIPSLAGLNYLTNFDVSNNLLSGPAPAVPSPANALNPGGSRLCPNALNHTADAAWDVATGRTPWYVNCGARTWTGASSADWNDGSNWMDGFPPALNDQLIFNSTALGFFENSNSNFGSTTFGSISIESNNDLAKHYTLGGTHPITVDGNAPGSLQKIQVDNIGIGGGEQIAFPLILAGPMSIIVNNPYGTSGALYLNAVQLQTTPVLSGNGHLFFTGTITQSGGARGLTMNGSGIADITTPAGNASYTGPTVVNSGTLSVTGLSIASSSGVTVNAGGAFVVQNNGTAPAINSLGGTVGAGTTGTPLANTGSLTLDSASTFLITFSHFLSNHVTQFNVTGTVSLGSSHLVVDPYTPCLAPDPGFVPAPGDVFTIINNDGLDPIVGTFAGLPEGAYINVCGTAYRISYAGGSGNDVTLTYAATSAHTVTYDGNGYTGGMPPSDGKGYVNGATVTVLGNTGGMVKKGYTFAGWNTAPDGSGTRYAAGSTFAIGSANVTLYAHWVSKFNPAIELLLLLD